jgi:hypothetical protein
LEKTEGNRPLGKPRCKWKDNITIDLQKAGWVIDWIDLPQDRDTWQALINETINLRVP